MKRLSAPAILAAGALLLAVLVAAIAQTRARSSQCEAEVLTSTGLVRVTIPGRPPTIYVDTSYILYRTWLPGGAIPQAGAECASPKPADPSLAPASNGTGAVWAGREGVFFCVQNERHTGFIWVRAAVESQ